MYRRITVGCSALFHERLRHLLDAQRSGIVFPLIHLNPHSSHFQHSTHATLMDQVYPIRRIKCTHLLLGSVRIEVAQRAHLDRPTILAGHLLLVGLP
jgi:hypothetical protein